MLVGAEAARATRRLGLGEAAQERHVQGIAGLRGGADRIDDRGRASAAHGRDLGVRHDRRPRLALERRSCPRRPIRRLRPATTRSSTIVVVIEPGRDRHIPALSRGPSTKVGNEFGPVVLIAATAGASSGPSWMMSPQGCGGASAQNSASAYCCASLPSASAARAMSNASATSVSMADFGDGGPALRPAASPERTSDDVSPDGAVSDLARSRSGVRVLRTLGGST